MRRSSVHCLTTFVFLAFMSPLRESAAEPPETLSELADAWRKYSVEQSGPMWGVLTRRWTNNAPTQLDMPYTQETRTTWIIDAPPHRLLRTVTHRDGNFQKETSHASNADYLFSLYKGREDEGYRLTSLSANSGSAAEKLQRRVEGWRLPWQNRQLFLAHETYLVDLVEKHPKWFALRFNKDGDGGLTLTCSRDAVEDGDPPDYFDIHPSATFILNESRPWLPVRHEFVYDRPGDGKEPSPIVNQFDDDGSYTTTTPFVTLELTYEGRKANDKQLSRYTRLASYGLPEPAMDGTPDLNADVYAIVNPELIGERAPDFGLPILGGQKFQLSQHKGEVVIMDFWATWCPPCVASLPEVAGVVKELNNPKVVFYAVNVGQDAETVREFLNGQKFSVPVLLDEQEAVARQYQVKAIPQVVLIGKEGRIQAVHIGRSSETLERLRNETILLLKGEDLSPIDREKPGQGP